MRLVPASAALATDLARAHAEGFDAPWSQAEIATLFEASGVFGYLVDEAGPIGMILCRVAFDEAEVLTVAVAPATRRRGIGRALVQAACDRAATSGARSMFLEVAVDNSRAIALYEALEFREAGRRPKYYDRGEHGRVDALVMRRDLNAD